MELKDQIICGGVIIGNVLTAAALLGTIYFNYKGRRNTLREHIYKEQLSCYWGFCKEIIRLSSLLMSYSNAKEDKDDIDFDEWKKLYPKIDKQFTLVEDISAAAPAICSPQIEMQMRKLISQMSDYYVSLTMDQELDEDAALNNQEKTYNILVRMIREELRITEHSTENYQLYSSNRKEREQAERKQS